MSDPVCYVTSDLHLGSGSSDVLEDFHHDNAFAAWVGGLHGPATMLVLNGDVIDFAQIEPLNTANVPSSLLWDEAASLEKFARACEGHPKFFDALGGFIDGGGRIGIVIGNHDLDMIWPQVQAGFRQRVGERGDDRVRFEVAALDICGVRIEHGHHFTPENCPKDPRAFLHRYDDGKGERLFLERVWGTDFVLSFYNQLKREFPFAGNAKPALRVLAAGVRHHWVEVRHLLVLLAFLKRRKLPPTWWDGVLAGQPHLERLREDVLLDYVAGSFSEPEWQKLAIDLAGDAELRAELESALGSLELEDLAALKAGVQVRLGESPSEPEMSEATVLRLFRDSREVEAARDLADRGARHVVCGHTHHVIEGEVLNERGARLFNPGTWIPRLRLEDPAVTARIDADGLSLHLLNDRSLYVWDLRAVEIPTGNPDGIQLVTIPHARSQSTGSTELCPE